MYICVNACIRKREYFIVNSIKKTKHRRTDNKPKTAAKIIYFL